MTGSGERVGDHPGLGAPPAAGTPDRPRRLRFNMRTLKVVRAMVVQCATAAGLGEDRVQDAELVASELTANSVEHGGGEGELCLWRDATHLIIEVSDAGHIDDPLAGRRPVPPDSVGGRGLLLVHKLADLVRVHTGPGGTTIRVYFTRAMM
ncbi:ATP-binding protein [Actinomadura sp. BRA 177]|uniref:ATP-binding protein n=1 Tax=Actinomadura sp. BRA 177 TaxID=2745202 RepID=UPI0015962488|nr:ATP-binding protein [Actinomadura sp. BRA 177]NVI88485.1 ATP-binding protein [Actinomadura sp. BRA 177]